MQVTNINATQRKKDKNTTKLIGLDSFLNSVKVNISGNYREYIYLTTERDMINIHSQCTIPTGNHKTAQSFGQFVKMV